MCFLISVCVCIYIYKHIYLYIYFLGQSYINCSLKNCWMVFNLQCCAHFRYTANWVNYTFTIYPLSFLKIILQKVLTEHWTESSVLTVGPYQFVVVQLLSCLMLCNPMGFPVLPCLLESAQVQVHWVCGAVWWSHMPLPSSLACLLSSYQCIFQWVSSLHQMAKALEPSASASVLSMNTQDWFPLRLTGLISLQSKGLLRVFSSTTMQSSILWHSAFFMIQLSHPYMTTRKIITLTIWIYRILEGFASLSSSDFILSKLSTMIHLSWMALHSMDHSFIELYKLLYHYKAVIYEGTLLVTYSIHNSVYRSTKSPNLSLPPPLTPLQP